MTDAILERMEDHIRRLEGNLTHVKRVYLLSKLIAEHEGMAYDVDILAFASYFHDVAAYPYLTFVPPVADFDHALESSKLIPDFAQEYGYNGAQTDMIVEVVKYHDKPGMGSLNETRLIRNADGVDYLGYMAVARDFSRFPNDYGKVLATLKRRKGQFLPIVDLPYAKELAAPRIIELEHYICRFEEECYGVY